MKKLASMFTAIAVSITILYAQVPQAFNYSGYAYDSKGKEISNKNISVKASILEGSMDGTKVYEETQMVLTNWKGLFSVKVGRGEEIIGIFGDIDWGGGPKYLKIEIDPNGGASYQYMGSVELLSVPYALYAGSAGDANDADSDPENELQILEFDAALGELSIANGNTVNIGKPDNPEDEIQDLELVGTSLRITNNPSATPINLENVVVQEGQYYFGDMDIDNYGNPFNPVWVPTGVEPPTNFVEESTDCDDNDAEINPDAEEVYDNVDNNCNGVIDENTCVDNDGDGYGTGPACLGADCDDNNPNIYPGSTLSEECGSDIGTCQPGTRSKTCLPNGNWSSWSSCTGEIGPSQEICDGLDNDCDGVVDNVNCPNVSHGNTGCQNGNCSIISCSTNYYDADGVFSNGCECYITPNGNNSFNTNEYLGTISDNGGEKSKNGKLIPTNDSDYFRITVNDDFPGVFDPQFQVLENPGSQYVFKIYNENMLILFETVSGTTSIPNSVPGEFPTYDDTQSYYIKVERVSFSDCGNYSFRVYDE